MTETTPTSVAAPAAAPAAVLSTVTADAAKAATVVKADVATAKADVIAVDGKLTAFIKNNAGKIAVAVLVAAALVVWKLI